MHWLHSFPLAPPPCALPHDSASTSTQTQTVMFSPSSPLQPWPSLLTPCCPLHFSKTNFWLGLYHRSSTVYLSPPNHIPLAAPPCPALNKPVMPGPHPTSDWTPKVAVSTIAVSKTYFT